MPRFAPSLSIRHKVLVALIACFAAVGGLAALSLSKLAEIDDKLAVVEMAHDLSDTVLEARRYEKNYLLYALPPDLEEAIGFAGKAVDLSQAVESRSISLSALNQARALAGELKGYQSALAALRGRQGSTAVDPETLERLRGLGKDLVDKALGLVRYERSRIDEIIASLRAELIFAVGAFLIMATAISVLVRRKVVMPLAAIEQATRKIARGEFETVDAPRRNDETGRVLTAFDTMVRELEMRQDQLVQSKKLSSIGTLAAGIAHQLNNPLNNISTSCQIAVEEFDAGDRELLLKMLGNIDKETLRARDIVRGLLDFAREKEFALAPTPVAKVLRSAVRLVSSQVPSRVSIKVEAPEELIAPLDTQKMQEVFINLIINAVQAMGDNGGTITLAARLAEEGELTPPPCAEITVADTGEGIPEQVASQIFDPFFTTKDVGVGTGLGLSIVYGIVKKHGGTIEIESDPGLGATFFIRLPSASMAAASEET